MLDSNHDPTGLGQWAWTRYRGRNSIITRVVCAYRPCLPMGTDKVYSVYTQHQCYWDAKHIDVCPREAFTTDLCTELDLWLQHGEQVIIALDANENQKDGSLAKAFHTHQL